MSVRIYVEVVHYIELIPLAQNTPADASEWFHFCSNLALRRSFALRRNYPSGTSEFILFWCPLGLYLGVKNPRDSFSGIPLCFRWCLGITSFWRPLGSSLESSRRRLGNNSVWRPFRSPLGFAIPWDSFSGIPPCFPPLGFTLIFRSRGTTFFPVGGFLFFSFLGEPHLSFSQLIFLFPSGSIKFYHGAYTNFWGCTRVFNVWGSDYLQGSDSFIKR